MGNLTPHLGIVCGMVSERHALGRWADHPRVRVAVSGAVPGQAEAAARQMAAAGVRGLLSWGLAGGLAADLTPGTVIRPRAVILPDGTKLEFGRGMQGDMAVLGSEHVVCSPADKARLRAGTGAIAVDMESHRLAQVASAQGLDLHVVRAISDPAARALPAFAARALGPDGRPRIGRVLAGLVRRPGDLPALLSAKRDSDRALHALRAVADDLIADLIG